MTPRGAVCAVWRPASSVVQHLLRLLVLCLAGLLLLTSGWLLLRRLSGGLEQPLSGTGFLLLGVTVAGLLVGADALACRLTGWPAGAWQRWSVVHRVLLTLAGVALGVAVSLPGTQWVLFWLPVACGSLWSWRDLALPRWRSARPWQSNWIRRRPQPLGPTAAINSSSDEKSAERELPDSPELGDESESEDCLLPADVSQRIVRARDGRGAEVIHATVRCAFAAGQRQQSVHVAFCPPLEAVAELTADQLSGPAAQIKTVMLETFGASLELKLGSPSRQPADVQIQFFAFEKPASDGAM